MKQIEPSLELERVGLPTGLCFFPLCPKRESHREASADLANTQGDNCGSTQIDKAFKKWLRQLLGDKLYQRLDENSENERVSSHTSQGKAMRKLMASFDEVKRSFHKEERDMLMDLPEPLHNLNLDTRVNSGEITISKYVSNPQDTTALNAKAVIAPP